MKTEHEVASEVILHLEAVRERPTLYLGSATADSAWGVVLGMMLTLHLCGYPEIIPRHDQMRDNVWQDRGWDVNRELLEQMQSKNMSQAAMFNEIMNIEIVSLRRRVEAMHE